MYEHDWIYVNSAWLNIRRKESKLTNFFLIISCEYIHVNIRCICIFMKTISILFNRFYILTTKIHSFEWQNLWKWDLKWGIGDFLVYIHLTLIFFIFVNLVRYLKCFPCPFWWRKWVLLVSRPSSCMTNSLVLWKFMLDKKGYPSKGSLFSNICGLVFISTTELFTRKLLLNVVNFYLHATLNNIFGHWLLF